MALLCHAESLRDVIAFPKSFRGKDLLTGAPADVDKSDLKEYHISLNTTSVKWYKWYITLPLLLCHDTKYQGCE